MAYMITSTAQFGTIDLNSGTFTLIGNQSTQLVGLGVANGELFGTAGNTLYKVNLANGALTRVGSSTTISVFGSTLTGLYGRNLGHFYSIDPITGAATEIGNGVLPYGAACNNSAAFSTNSATLYLACGSSLYTVDVTNGTASWLGTGSAVLYALTTLNGTLYGGEFSPASAVVSVNPSSGTVTTVHSLQGTAAAFYGLAPLIASPPPTINPGGIVPIYSTSTTIQPSSWISIYGTNFIGATSLWGGDFPTSLGGVTVTVNNKPAYLWLVTPSQINLQAPDDTATGSVNVTVTNKSGSATSMVTLEPYGPSFSLFGTHYPAALVPTPGLPGNSGSGYDLIGPANAFSFASRPVKAGETLVLYGVGFGPTTPVVLSGKVFSGAAQSVTFPQITIGGVTATVTYAGIVQAGLYQINVVVPNAGHGDQTLQASIGGLTAPQGVFITLQ